MWRIDAQARCDSDAKCLGLHWLNRNGGDGRLVSQGTYQGCGGEVATAASGDWDTIVKPGKVTTITLCVACIYVCLRLRRVVEYGYAWYFMIMHGYFVDSVNT